MNVRVKFLITGDETGQILYEKMKYELTHHYAYHIDNVMSANATGPSVMDESEFPVIPVILNIVTDEYANRTNMNLDIIAEFIILEQTHELENYYIGIQEIVIDGVMLPVPESFRLERFNPEILHPMNRITQNTIQEPSWDDSPLEPRRLWNSPLGISSTQMNEPELIEI